MAFALIPEERNFPRILSNFIHDARGFKPDGMFGTLSKVARLGGRFSFVSIALAGDLAAKGITFALFSVVPFLTLDQLVKVGPFSKLLVQSALGSRMLISAASVVYSGYHLARMKGANLSGSLNEDTKDKGELKLQIEWVRGQYQKLDEITANLSKNLMAYEVKMSVDPTELKELKELSIEDLDFLSSLSNALDYHKGQLMAMDMPSELAGASSAIKKFAGHLKILIQHAEHLQMILDSKKIEDGEPYKKAKDAFDALLSCKASSRGRIEAMPILSFSSDEETEIKRSIYSQIFKRNSILLASSLCDYYFLSSGSKVWNILWPLNREAIHEMGMAQGVWAMLWPLKEKIQVKPLFSKMAYSGIAGLFLAAPAQSIREVEKRQSRYLGDKEFSIV